MAASARNQKLFDRKFGAEVLQDIPTSPGIYRFLDDAGALLYVGKSKSLRARLRQYRNAGRQKRDRKAKRILKRAMTLKWERTVSETDALLLENELIRVHRPPFNVVGAYWFLYPSIGIAVEANQLAICFTTAPDEVRARWPKMRLFGSYRQRQLARLGFDGLVTLLGRAGHAEGRAATARRFAPAPYTKLWLFRQVSEEVSESMGALLEGESADVLVQLATALLERASARRDSSQVQEALDQAKTFFGEEAAVLRKLRLAAGEGRVWIPQEERDRLLILAKAPKT